MATPNKHGVYSSDEAETISFELETKKGWCAPVARCSIRVIEIDPGTWITAITFDFMTGDFSGYSEPLSAHKTYSSREAAITHSLDRLIASLKGKLERGPIGCATQTQMEYAERLLKKLEQYGGKETEGQLSLLPMF